LLARPERFQQLLYGFVAEVGLRDLDEGAKPGAVQLGFVDVHGVAYLRMSQPTIEWCSMCAPM
jgi:hypothetical protein